MTDLRDLSIKKALVTGCNGFIAQHLIRRLEADGYTVRGTTRQESENIEDILQCFEPQCLYHLGAELQNSCDMFHANVMLTVRLLDYCKRSGCHFIYVGSSSEYGRKREAMRETDCLEPETMYEATKGAATLMARGYAHTYRFPVSIMRPFTIYGPGEKPHKFLQRLLSRPAHIQVSKGVHDYVYITDFIEALIRLPLEQKEKSILFDIFNIGSGIQTQNLDVICLFEEVLKEEGHPHKFEITGCESKPYDSDMWVCDTSYVRKKYDFTCKVSLKEGLRYLIKSHANADGTNC